MENRQLKNLGIILILPILFAGFGYFGMKMFLSGSGPKTVMPEKNTSSIIEGSKADTTNNSNANKSSSSSEKAADSQAVNTNKQSETSQNESQNKSETAVDEKTGESGSQTESTNTDLVEQSETVQESNPMSSYTFSSIDFFSLQVGSYSSLSNAQKHVESLKGEGVNAYVFHGKNYKVMAGVNATRDGVEGLKEHVASTIPDAFVKGLMIVPDVLKYPEEGQGSKAFDDIVKTYKNRLNKHIQGISDIQSKSNEEILLYLNEDVESIEKIISSIDKFSGDESFKDVLANLKKIMNVTDQKVRQKINGEINAAEVFTLYIEELMSYNKMN